MTALWRVASVALALLAGFGVPLLVLLVLLGVAETGPAGAVAIVVLVAVGWVGSRLLRRRLRTPAARR